MATLTRAHRQWESRPADERFTNMHDLHAHVAHQREIAKVGEAAWTNLRAEVIDGDIALVGKTGAHTTMTNWSFGQLSRVAEAPAGYLSTLPANLAVDCLNHGLGKRGLLDPDGKARLLMAVNGERTLRAVTSPNYTRIWNASITERLMPMLDEGWINPPAYKFNPITGRPTWGGEMEPSGLYAGDRDMFVFLVNEQNRIDAGGGRMLARGVFIWNSEVGARVFGISTFLYDYVCGNHYVWGATKVVEKKIRHVGNAGEKAFGELALIATEYANASAVEDEARIKAARLLTLGDDEDAVVTNVVKLTGSTQRLARESFKLATEFAEVDGNPTSLWGMVAGITRYAQLSPWADQRVEVDDVASRLFVKALAA